MKKVVYIIAPLLAMIFSSSLMAASCSTATQAGVYALETTMSKQPTTSNEYLQYGFNGRLTLNANGTVIFNSTESTELNGIYGNGGTWAVAPGTCKITITNLDFYNFIGGYLGNFPIITDVDFWFDPSYMLDDNFYATKVAYEFIGRGNRNNMDSNNQFTNTINTDYYGRFKLSKTLRPVAQ